ncbi:uncharacterized protein LOC122663059 [Telopea speciosissima]|uniref:uncharacterized protein LOC122663059 n=1 Tax=Telopea speciosissima TaxID=54955 RepID=UPI001CC47C46|nr:uncharacterized protein LOC122663059 [Telopea speciosissima]
MSLLIASLSNEALPLAIDRHTSKEIWDAVHAAFSCFSTTRLLSLIVALQNFMHNLDESVTQFLHHAKALSDELTGAGKPLPIEVFNIHIFCSLRLENQSLVPLPISLSMAAAALLLMLVMAMPMVIPTLLVVVVVLVAPMHLLTALVPFVDALIIKLPLTSTDRVSPARNWFYLPQPEPTSSNPFITITFGAFIFSSMVDGTRLSKIDEAVKNLQLLSTSQLQENTDFRKKSDATFANISTTLQQFQIQLTNIEAKLNQPQRTSSSSSSGAPSNFDVVSQSPSGVVNGPRYMRLKMPRFDGTDPSGWIFKAQQFFDYHSTPADQRLIIASFHMDGAALSWYQWMSANGLLQDWPPFLASLATRFGPSLFEDHRGALSKLTQMGTVAEYQSRFEALSNKVSGIPEPFLISFFISGLKPDLNRELLVAQPTSLVHAISLARLYEEKFLASRQSFKPSWPKLGPPSADPILKTPPPPASAGPVFKPRLSPHEMKARRDKGLCYNCDEKFVAGHRCKGKLFMLSLDDSQLIEVIDNNLDVAHGATSTDDIEAVPEISFHALASQFNPKTLRLNGFFNEHQLHILIDSGSTHNFIQESVAIATNCPICPTKAFKVYIGNGDFLMCNQQCKGVSLRVQGSVFLVDLFVLPIKGASIVLGIQWLETLGPVLTDYKKLSMEFTLGGSPIRLVGEPVLNDAVLHVSQLKKLISRSEGASFFHLKVEIDNDLMEPSWHLLPHRVQSVLQRFSKVFAEPHTLPPHRNTDHNIHLVPGAQPVNVHPYRYPHFQKNEMERFPIPTIDELLDELNGATVFSKLDLRAGYHQIRVKTQDIEKTGFRTHDGHYEFLVMPFGLTNAPATFQATMNSLFKPFLRKFVTVFFDDIFVYSKTLEDHLLHLSEVLQCLTDNQFLAKGSKCQFCQSSLGYLGHLISSNGVEPDPTKISAIMEWPLPMNIKQLRGFLGLTGYYRRFVRHYAHIASPLTDMLKKDCFSWTDNAKLSFEALKHAMTPVLAFPNFLKVFEVETDASGVGIGAVLIQEGHPIAFFSKKLCDHMRQASAYVRELYALPQAVQKWRHYLLGRHFLIKTDHRSLKHLLTQVIPTPEQHLFLSKLLGYSYTIIYKPGKENVVADSLSRSTSKEEDQIQQAE